MATNNNNGNRNGNKNDNTPKRVGRIEINKVSTVDKIPQVPVVLAHASQDIDLGEVKAIADTGAEVCVAGTHLLPKRLLNSKHLRPPNSTLFTFNGQSSPCVGILPVRLSNNLYKTEAEIYICPAAKGTLLLSLDVCKKLGYVRQDFPDIIPPTVGQVKNKWIIAESASKEKQRDYYDARAKDLPPLRVGQRVRIQDSFSKLWDKVGRVLEISRDRSYKVEVDSGSIFWRNRKFIRPVPEPSDSASEVVQHGPSQASSKMRGEKRVRFQLPPPEPSPPNPPIPPNPPRRSSRPSLRPNFYGSSPTPPSRQAQRGDDAST